MKPVALTHRFAATDRHQRGASLLEGIAYLGIAAIVILGAVSLLTGAFSSAQSNRLGEEVVSIRTGVKKLYMGQAASYVAGSLNPVLVNAQVLPATLSVTLGGGGGGALTVNNAWGGTVDITGATATFTITYTLVPREVCIGGLSGASGWQNITVNAGTAITEFPVGPAAANTACGAATNTIVWTSH